MRRTVVFAVIGALAWALPAIAQQPGVVSGGVSVPTVIELNATQRSGIAESLIARWSGQVMKMPNGDVKAWSSKLRKVVATADSANVQRASQMPSLDLVHTALVGGPINDAAVKAALSGAASASAPQVLGSTIADTTYTPLPNGRCRVASSIAIGSPLVQNEIRPIDIEEVDSYIFQGGVGSSAGDGSENCGIPIFATAIAISASSRNPAASGVLKIFPGNKTSSAGNTILFSPANGGGAADLIVESCQSCIDEIAIQANQQTHYIIDVIGYFMPAQATPLECSGGPVFSYNALGVGASITLAATQCPSGYGRSSTTCESTNTNVAVVGTFLGSCIFKNNGASTATVEIRNVCCRVPGR